ncbi:MAG: hypothetical protein R3C03_14180 [Pirellulaceae bacterium]
MNSIAAQDYVCSLERFGGRLSNPIRELFLQAQRPDELHYSVIVIGSGYGASIAQLVSHAERDHRIAILERGRMDTSVHSPILSKNVTGQPANKMTGPGQGQVTNPLGLFDLSFNNEVNVLSSALWGDLRYQCQRRCGHIRIRLNADGHRRSTYIGSLDPYFDMAARQLSLSRTPFDAG